MTLTSLAAAAVIGQLAKPSTLPELVGWQNTSVLVGRSQRGRVHQEGKRVRPSTRDEGRRKRWVEVGGWCVGGVGEDVRVQPPVAVVAHWPLSWQRRPMTPVQPGAQ